MAAVPAHYDGLYSGLVCYADGRVDPAHCYRAQGSVSQGKISGQWPGREPGITMILTGDVLPSGEVKIEMRARTAVGLPVAIINLSGAIRDGRLDATGSFVTGRAASMNWRKN